ncbi:hypothetical protein [Novosphingobium umbonatum]|uniref:hypothetical protein n=1 Tax=Novosphingobium umbonatum TaxID=1908524 RepID=UPI0015F2D46D|nr:hypothetical protein [Novosphingobium umbonatum]
MPIAYQDSVASFDGDVTVEEAGEFVEWLLAEDARQVDLTPCTGLHSALLQSLMALQPRLVALPQDQQLARWLAPFVPRPQGLALVAVPEAPEIAEPTAEATDEAETVLPPLRSGQPKKKTTARRSRNSAKHDGTTETVAKEPVE